LFQKVVIITKLWAKYLLWSKVLDKFFEIIVLGFLQQSTLKSTIL